MIPPIICSSMAGNCRRCCFGGCSSLSLSGVSSGSPLVPSIVVVVVSSSEVVAVDIVVVPAASSWGSLIHAGTTKLPSRPPPCRRRRPHRFFGNIAAGVLDTDVVMVTAVTTSLYGAGRWLLLLPPHRTRRQTRRSR